MADAELNDDDLVDYEEEEAEETKPQEEVKKGGTYSGIHASGFRDFLLKPELLRAVVDCGFEHPSEVQHECIPQAILGMDVICQAKSGMGKTAVFVLATLHQLEAKENTVCCLVLCHARELAYQICNEFERFSRYLPDVMMFSATLSTDMRAVCKKFMQDPMEIYVDDSKLTLHGLQQHYVKLAENEKNRKLNELLDALEFNQAPSQRLFVKSVSRANALDKLLQECNFPSVAIHGSMKQEERIKLYQNFKDFKHRILVSTDIWGRGIDIERVNIVVNYDMPDSSDTYLHRVGRAGRFGTKGLAITFASTDEDAKILEDVSITQLPETIDVTSYMTA
ncbi:hypothetical protein EMIHUDRAFT_433653 [Emiliania huxleyi CCMP1516]|uniref:RNA helicase n=2 Tax=Emiliania huxleyi TaxID=2903 RepID=A0A0D3KR39_EMIH1|nr:hypothetical protein EMIHUDRAFT_433653 [Emiliania huxleyi CCMP1516]EOD38224.1 hypothetical protein EMIHUDRAFT_433653 [Emiliania huxleyi CCMP1516]|eukprot:XP_005790653.1 hypothetical protein EMIHUDRAFT_433653 [Emiliania huxleyi CCMP1516]